ncbi:MAG: hypothetical protein Q7U24_09380 [Sulfurimicrobium sp.]|nr:hypothetical protein [Sulfurimicrobium sp.]
MAYPNRPPATDASVVKRARRQALDGLARLMGASITSGGIGKNDDSAKLIAPRYQGARRCRDQTIAR